MESANIAEECDDEQLFFFVTYLASLILLINGTMTEYVIVKLGLVRDPQQPLDLFTTFKDFEYAELKRLDKLW